MQALSYLIFCLLITCTSQIFAAEARVVKSSDGWKLLVDGKPFFVKGMCYNPSQIGEGADEGTLRDWMIVDDDHDGRMDYPYQSWVDTNKNNERDPDEKESGDFRLLQEMGCNVIRIYHHASSSKQIQALHRPGTVAELLYNHEPNKQLLRDLFKNYGIRIAMGDYLGAYAVGSGASWEEGTNYKDPVQRKNMLASVEDMVREFKDEPYILMWILGNENNYSEFTHTNAAKYPKEYAEFVNEAAKTIKKIDSKHPVCLSNGEIQLLYVYGKYTPDVDIFGLNSYRKPGFGNLWEQVASVYDKPVLLTEYGTSHPKVMDGDFDEEDQSELHRLAYCDMWNHRAGDENPGNAIGGFVYEWVDNWWQDGEPENHGLGPQGWNHEWNGMTSQGNGSNSPLLRQIRKVYFTYKSLWNTETNQCLNK